MKKFAKILMWIIVGVLFLGTFVYLIANSRPKKDTYQLVNPSNETIERTTVLTGKIEPRDEIEIKPQISGIISEILVEPGDQVTNGQIIAKIKVIPDATQLSSAETASVSHRFRSNRAASLSNVPRRFTRKNMRAARNTRPILLPITAQRRRLTRPKTSCASFAKVCRHSTPKAPTLLSGQL